MIEELCKRFPLLSKMVFEDLDDECLARVQESSKEINSHLQNQRFYWIRILKKHNRYFEEFADPWKKVIEKTPVEIVKELAMTVKDHFNDTKFNKRAGDNNQLHPLHIAAGQGHLQLCKHIVEKPGVFNPKQAVNYTALHFAAAKGHIKVYKFILNNVDDWPFMNNLMK